MVLETGRAAKADMPDKELIARCIGQDKQAWDIFVERFSRLIYHQIYRCLRSRAQRYQQEDLEDYYHTVFLALLDHDCRKLRQFQGNCSLATWIRTITTTQVIDQLRRKRMEYSLDREDTLGIPMREKMQGRNIAQEERLMGSEQKEILRRELEQASPEDRLLAVLIYQRELPVPQVAKTLGISKEAVYTRKHRLQQKLQKSLEERGLL